MSDKALRVPLGLSTWQELNRRTSTFSRAYGDHTEVEPDPHPQYVTKAFAQTAWSYAGYGALNLLTPSAAPAIGAGWATLEFDTVSPVTKFVSLDVATNSFQFLQDGVWAISLAFSVDHTDSNQGRTFQVRLFDETDGVQIGQTVNVGVGRNVEVTTFANVNLLFLTDAQEGHPIHFEVGNASAAFSGVTWTMANFATWAVGEWPDPL